MLKTPLFKSTFLLLLLVGVLYLIRTEFYLSWTTWWFDMILHFLAGGVVGMATLLILQKFFNIETLSFLRIISVVIISVFVVGILWEVYELYFGITFLSDGIFYIMDTVSDLVLDICGGFFGVLYGIKKDKN